MKKIIYFVPLLCFLAVIMAFGGPQKFFFTVISKFENTVSSADAYGDFMHDKEAMNNLITAFREQTEAPILVSEMQFEQNKFYAFVQNNNNPENANEIYFEKGAWGKAPLKIIGGGGKLHGKLGNFDKINTQILIENAIAAKKKSEEIGFENTKIEKIKITLSGNDTFRIIYVISNYPKGLAEMETDMSGKIINFKEIK